MLWMKQVVGKNVRIKLKTIILKIVCEKNNPHFWANVMSRSACLLRSPCTLREDAVFILMTNTRQWPAKNSFVDERLRRRVLFLWRDKVKIDSGWCIGISIHNLSVKSSQYEQWTTTTIRLQTQKCVSIGGNSGTLTQSQIFSLCPLVMCSQKSDLFFICLVTRPGNILSQHIEGWKLFCIWHWGQLDSCCKSLV